MAETLCEELNNIILGRTTSSQQTFLNTYFKDQEVDSTKVFDLVSALAGAPYLHDVRMRVYSGPMSGAQLGIIAELDDSQFSTEIEKLKNMTNSQREQRGLARTIEAYERLEKHLERPGLFHEIGLREVNAGDPLKNLDELDYYALQGTVRFSRNANTRYHINFAVPLELRVKNT